MKIENNFLEDEDEIIVCDNCLQASCWAGIFMCDKARDAGIIKKKVKELKRLNLEHPDYWVEQKRYNL